MDALIVVAVLFIWLLINPFWATVAALVVSAFVVAALIRKHRPLLWTFLKALIFG